MSTREVRRIPRNIDGETTLDRIKRNYSDPGTVRFTPQEEELHTRLLEAYKQLIDNHGNKVEVVTKLMDIFSVDRSTAYRYIKNSEELFGKSQRLDKEVARVIVNDMLSQAFKLAKKKKDEYAMVKIAEAMMKNNGTDKEDLENPFENFQPNLFCMVVPGNGNMISVNLDKAHELPEDDVQRIINYFQDAQEIEFEEVTENE